MGTWGPNNFENDRAHDYLIEFLDKLIEEIRTDMTTLQRTSALSEVGEYRIMPTLDIFLTLNDASHARQE